MFEFPCFPTSEVEPSGSFAGRPRSVGVAGCTRTFSFVVVVIFAVRLPLKAMRYRSRPARTALGGTRRQNEKRGPGFAPGPLAVGVERSAQKSMPPPPGMGGADGC